MTIELALSGLSMSMFCTLITLLLIGVGLIFSAGMICGFIKALVFLLKVMKGGMDDLKESIRAMSPKITTNN